MLAFSLTFGLSHGYGRWQDIANDPKFTVINEPFRRGKLSPLNYKCSLRVHWLNHDCQVSESARCWRMHDIGKYMILENARYQKMPGVSECQFNDVGYCQVLEMDWCAKEVVAVGISIVAEYTFLFYLVSLEYKNKFISRRFKVGIFIFFTCFIS